MYTMMVGQDETVSVPLVLSLWNGLAKQLDAMLTKVNESLNEGLPPVTISVMGTAMVARVPTVVAEQHQDSVFGIYRCISRMNALAHDVSRAPGVDRVVVTLHLDKNTHAFQYMTLDVMTFSSLRVA